MTTAPFFFSVRWKNGGNAAGESVERAARAIGIRSGKVRVSRLYASDVAIDRALAERALADAIVEEVAAFDIPPEGSCHVVVSRLDGVTDDEGAIAADVLGLPFGSVRSGRIYGFEAPLDEAALRRLGSEIIGNPIVDRIDVSTNAEVPLPVRRPVASTRVDDAAPSLDVDDEALVALSKAFGLALSLDELRAIRSHFQQQNRSGPTRCELEIFAQTWSEHCKHKEFNAIIDVDDGGVRSRVEGLFGTFVRRSTETIRQKWQALGEDWMVTVFSDNAGVVRIDDERLFVLKVETHNSPSALDPFGGAMTGVLGTNRDAIGTGKGGAKLLFNTAVLCFATPTYDRPLLPGQLAPARVAAGVIEGIEAAGNRSGVPTVNGAVIFDDRFGGKPLVYCGTGALLPSSFAGSPSHRKDLEAGDAIVVIGGRVGRDGIHGATFSSEELGAGVSRGVVQIGSPFTQKLVADFLEEACEKGLVSAATDNGAGGLSSSIGELAQLSGGAVVDVAKVPRKYDGLAAWEVFLSESQERMTLSVRPANVDALGALAKARGVEASVIGTFTSDGALVVNDGDDCIARLDLRFLHDGAPRKHLVAKWVAPIVREPIISVPTTFDELLRRVLAAPNVACRERVVRRFDHEVKGRSVVKALMGERGLAPQDAAVLRVAFDGFTGLAIASGIAPKLGDLDPYEASAGAFDEAVRSLISVGARLPTAGEKPMWSACDNFCVPDSAFHEKTNPDGAHKLGALVRMCRALFDFSTFFDVPMTSGKDSMKNDFVSGGVKISVPPTVLYTVTARIDDVRRVVTSEWKAPGDVVYVVGKTYDEMGASEALALFGELGTKVPRVRKDDAMRTYQSMMINHAEGLLASSHDVSDGGLAACLAECAIGGDLGAELTLPTDALASFAWLFSESPSRFVVSVRPEHQARFEAIFGGDAQRLGVVTKAPRLVIARAGARLVDAPLADLERAWRTAGGLP